MLQRMHMNRLQRLGFVFWLPAFYLIINLLMFITEFIPHSSYRSGSIDLFDYLIKLFEILIMFGGLFINAPALILSSMASISLPSYIPVIPTIIIVTSLFYCYIGLVIDLLLKKLRNKINQTLSKFWKLIVFCATL